MARPKRETVMARCAREALLAAIEIYNKPKVEYREQTVALLMVNAWEVLIKARIVQKSGGKIQSIYRRERDSRSFKRNDDNEIVTIGIRRAVGQTSLPEEVRNNIKGLIKIRNQATHMGDLSPDLKNAILGYSTASVQNFVKIYTEWFQDFIEAPYLLPVGFVGNAAISITSFPKRQSELLNELTNLAKSSNPPDLGYSVVMRVTVELNRGLSGGGSIGLTDDPRVPRVSITDDEALKTFPKSFNDIVGICRERYPAFKQNNVFYSAMRRINDNPRCAYVRSLDPASSKSPKKRFYNPEQTFAQLDQEFSTSK